MSMWIIKAPVTKDQDHLAMPDVLPVDISACVDEQEIKHVLQGMLPDAAPETIAVRAEQLGRFVLHVVRDDIIVIVNHDALLCGDVAGLPYAEAVAGGFSHRIPVAWFEVQPPAQALKHFPLLVERANAWPMEITNPNARAAISAKLPLPGNRFAKLKWLLGALFAMQAIAMVAGMLK